MARGLGCGKIIVESECIQVVNLVSRHSESWCEVESLVEVIWSQISFFTKIKFKHVSKERNNVADAIAKRTKSIGLCET